MQLVHRLTLAGGVNSLNYYWCNLLGIALFGMGQDKKHHFL
jgi:hypothetical protein